MASLLFDTPDVCHMLGIHHVTSAASAAFATAKSPRASAAKNVSTICVLSSTSIGHSPRLWRGAALKSQQLCSTERNGRRYIPAATLSQQPTPCNTGRTGCIVLCETRALSRTTDGYCCPILLLVLTGRIWPSRNNGTKNVKVLLEELHKGTTDYREHPITIAGPWQ